MATITNIRRGDTFTRTRIFYNPLPLLAGDTTVRPDLTSPINLTGYTLEGVFRLNKITILCTTSPRIVTTPAAGTVVITLSVADTLTLTVDDEGIFFFHLTKPDGTLTSILQRKVRVLEQWQ